jgi:four helix bundle protein
MAPLDGGVRSFRDLRVWQKSHALALGVYRSTAQFPKAEQYGLAAQMQRAVVSIAANIAEGFGRSSKLDKSRFLNIAQASLEEVRYYLILATDLGYPIDASLAGLAEEVGRMLDVYRRKILASARPPTTGSP